jgi:hypothetical protein
MAGAGYRTWTAGEVVTANNVQTYLQDQTVGVYAGTAARSSAILSPSEGQVSYRTDDDIVEVYDGTNWVPVSAPDTSGLVHINTTSFTSVSAVSVDNVFTANYSTYKFIVNSTGIASSVAIRMRASGVDVSSASYSRAGWIVRTNSTTSATVSTNDTSFAILASHGQGSTSICGDTTIYYPFEATRTNVINTTPFSSSSVFASVFSTGQLDTSASYDGFTAIFDTAISGSISIYGFRE